MFSVIIPLYNKAPYVVKALRSVMSQTFREFEVIIIDDGSTDQSYEVAQNFILQTTNFKLHTQPNQGVSIARNNGVALARYPYICFLDADDWWAPTFLDEMKALIEEFPEAGIYGTGYYIVKHSHIRVATIGVDDGFEKGEIDYCRVYAKMLCMPLTSISVCIPKYIFEKENGFKPALKLGEDFDLWIRIALKHKVVLLNKPLAYYNQDVEQQGRGVVYNKIYNPEIHFIFNIDYLLNFEKQNKELKLLLDKLRVYTLFRYRIQNAFPEQFAKEINKVDFTKQTIISILQYKLPLHIVRSYYRLKSYIRNLIK